MGCTIFHLNRCNNLRITALWNQNFGIWVPLDRISERAKVLRRICLIKYCLFFNQIFGVFCLELRCYKNNRYLTILYHRTFNSHGFMCWCVCIRVHVCVLCVSLKWHVALWIWCGKRCRFSPNQLLILKSHFQKWKFWIPLGNKTLRGIRTWIAGKPSRMNKNIPDTNELQITAWAKRAIQCACLYNSSSRGCL